MGFKDIPFESPNGYAQKGVEWKILYRHWHKEGNTLYSFFAFNYIDGLTAYEAWELCKKWPKELIDKGISPAFHECTFEQLKPFPYLEIVEKTKGVLPLISVLKKYEFDTLISN